MDKHTSNRVKIIIGIIALLLLILGAVAAVHVKYQKQKLNTEVAAGPVITGGLVGIGTTTITVKSTSGDEKTFTISFKTPVQSQVVEGEVGRVYNQLSVGDVLAVTVDPKNASVAKLVEIIPQASTTPAGVNVITRLATLVHISTSSIIIKPYTTDQSLVLTNTNSTFHVSAGTKFLTQAVGGQSGKPKEAFVPGVMVTVSGTINTAGDNNSARSVLLMLP